MKKLIPVTVALACSLLYMASCNKGDDNPYSDWRCTCFTYKATFVDTNIVIVKDTAILYANDMDRESAINYCNTTQAGYVDTFGSYANCTLK